MTTVTVTIDPTLITNAANALSALASAINGGTVITPPPPPPPPPPSGTSPDGTIIAPGGTLQDAAGNVWSFGTPFTDTGTTYGWHVLMNGQATTEVSFRLAIQSGIIWAFTSDNKWSYSSGGGFNSSATPPFAVPASPDQTTSNGGDGKFLNDANGAFWAFGPASGTTYIVQRNGIVYHSGAGNVMEIKGGVIWVKSGTQWYSDNGNGWTVQSAAPF